MSETSATGAGPQAFFTSMFRDPNQRRFAIAVWGTEFSLGGALGPIAGGVLLEFF